MQLYSVIKNDSVGDFLVWKFTGEDFNTGSQLIVAESEEALFYKNGVIEQTFDGGKYTLGTNNYPFISKLRNFMSADVSSFNAKVYYVNKAHKLELLWGTDTPIQMRDPKYNLQTSIRARGSYSIQVVDSKKFLIKLVGNNVQIFTKEDLNNYFRSAFLQFVKDKIPRVIKDSGREILDICTEKTAISSALLPVLSDVLDEYGVRVVNFYVSAIDIPENDPNRQVFEKAYARKAELNILDQDWGKIQATEILHDLATNPGAGGVAAAGAGIGMGFAAGNTIATMANQLFAPMSQTMQLQQIAQPQQPQSGSRFTQKTVAPNNSMIECGSCKTPNIQGAKFCNECGTKLVVNKVFCSNCGNEMTSVAKFCNECGTKRM